MLEIVLILSVVVCSILLLFICGHLLLKFSERQDLKRKTLYRGKKKKWFD